MTDTMKYTLIITGCILAFILVIALIPKSPSKDVTADVQRSLEYTCPEGVKEIIFDDSYGHQGFERPIDRVICK